MRRTFAFAGFDWPPKLAKSPVWRPRAGIAFYCVCYKHTNRQTKALHPCALPRYLESPPPPPRHIKPMFCARPTASRGAQDVGLVCWRGKQENRKTDRRAITQVGKQSSIIPRARRHYCRPPPVRAAAAVARQRRCPAAATRLSGQPDIS